MLGEELAMRVLFILALLASAAACRSEVIDIAALTNADKRLFSLAAELEGIETTRSSSYQNWAVGYDPELAHAGFAYTSLGLAYCQIFINPGEITPCVVGGYERMFQLVSRHEIRHCFGIRHSTNPASLMFAIVPCWPTNY